MSCLCKKGEIKLCEFCERFDFGSASYEIDRYGTRIVMAGSYRFPPERQFEFCPRCGASRDEILAKRLTENN